MATPMAHEFGSNFGTAWAFEKEVLEDSQRSPSETSSAGFAEIQDNFRLAPTMEEIKRTIVEHKSPVFNERYMSSEEALSPAEHDSDTGAEDDDSVFELGIAAPLRFTVCDMAVAIYIISVGKPKIVNIPVPSLTSSPSTGSNDSGRASWMPKRRSTTATPLKPILRQRNPNRPNLATLYSAPSFTEVHTTTTATTSNTSSNNSPALSSSSETTPPSSSYSDSTGHNSRRSSMFRSYSITSSPKKEFTVNRASTTHSFLDHDPYENASPPQHKRHSRFRNLSQKIKLPRFGKSNNVTEDDAEAQEERPFSPRPMSMIFSQSPPARRKMVARGAAEREPTIEIPPCPYDLDTDGELILENPMHRRKSLAF
jgi:hypothetical protein